jgi:hypothetical protein
LPAEKPHQDHSKPRLITYKLNDIYTSSLFNKFPVKIFTQTHYQARIETAGALLLFSLEFQSSFVQNFALSFVVLTYTLLI